MGRREAGLRAIVEAAIRDAFSGVQLGSGISIGEAEAIDGYWKVTSEADARAARASEVTDDWRAVPRSELDRDNFSHLDPEGLRYYLPALMLRLLEEYEPGEMWTITTILALAQRERHPWGFLELLTPEQRKAIAIFVKSFPELVELHPEDRALLARAFRDVWSRELVAAEPN